jgi:hypothetical protein
MVLVATIFAVSKNLLFTDFGVMVIVNPGMSTYDELDVVKTFVLIACKTCTTWPGAYKVCPDGTVTTLLLTGKPLS